MSQVRMTCLSLTAILMAGRLLSAAPQAQEIDKSNFQAVYHAAKAIERLDVVTLSKLKLKEVKQAFQTATSDLKPKVGQDNAREKELFALYSDSLTALQDSDTLSEREDAAKNFQQLERGLNRRDRGRHATGLVEYSNSRFKSSDHQTLAVMVEKYHLRTQQHFYKENDKETVFQGLISAGGSRKILMFAIERLRKANEAYEAIGGRSPDAEAPSSTPK